MKHVTSHVFVPPFWPFPSPKGGGPIEARVTWPWVAPSESANARLLVIDPLAAAYAGDENARGLVRAYMSDWDGWGREAGCAVMMIAHPPKFAHETGVTYSGSTDWEAAARTAWFIGQADESEGWSQKTKAAKVAAGVKPGRALYLEVTKSNYGPAPRRVWLDKDSDGLPHEVRPPTWSGDPENGGDTYDPTA